MIISYFIYAHYINAKIHLINLPTFHHLNEAIRVVDWIYIPRSQDNADTAKHMQLGFSEVERAMSGAMAPSSPRARKFSSLLLKLACGMSG